MTTPAAAGSDEPSKPADLSSHPTTEALSEFTEGLLAPAESELLAAHLDGCRPCGITRDALESVRVSLGALPPPPGMPEDIAARIDAALATAVPKSAAEARVSRETVPGGSSLVSRETQPSARPRRRIGPQPPSHSRGGAGAAGPAHPGSGRARPLGRRWRRASLAAAGAVAALALGTVVLVQGSGGGTTGDAGGSAASKREPSGEDGTMRQPGEAATPGNGGTKAELARRVRGLLATATPAPEVEAERSPRTPLEADPATVPRCIREGTGRTETPLAADPGMPYQGESAYLVVLPHPGDSSLVDAYVVDSSCTTGDAPGPGRVLARQTHSRP